MDYQTFELVHFPFAESRRRLIEGQAPPPDTWFKAYQRLIRIGKDMANTHDPNLANLYGAFERAAGQTIRKANQGLLTESPVFPVLLNEVVDEFGMRLDSVRSISTDQGRRAAIALFCAMYLECADAPLGIDLQSSANAAALYSGVASYAAWKAFAQVKAKSDLDLSEIAARSEEGIQTAVRIAQEQLQSTMERNGALQKQDAILRAQVQETIQELKTDVEQTSQRAAAAKVVFEEVLKQSKENEQRIALSQENIKRHADAIREEMRIDSTKKLWQQRAVEGTQAFQISAVAIAVLLIGPVLYAFSHLESLISILHSIGDAAASGIQTRDSAAHLTANAFARLAIITVPLAIYFWAVKLLVRYNARSMMLMDDARQRQTMMEVYTHLIENNGATSEERALVLNALFRPAPGHGPENVDPPTFTELLNKATSK